MPDDAARLAHLLDDLAVDADSRALAGKLYDATLAEGRSADEALDRARDALVLLRRQWADAKREDEG